MEGFAWGLFASGFLTIGLASSLYTSRRWEVVTTALGFVMIGASLLLP